MDWEFREGGAGHLVGNMIPFALERLLWPLCDGWGRDGLSVPTASTRAAVVTQGQVVKLHPLWYLLECLPTSFP